MASPILEPQAVDSETKYDENAQDTPMYLTSRIHYEPAKDGKPKQIATSLLDPSDLRRFSFSPFSQDGRTSPISLQGLHLPSTAAAVAPQSGPYARPGLRSFCTTQWAKHKAPIFVFVSQLFGALMNLCARLLELGEVDGKKLHPMQLLFWRMALTSLACTLYTARRHLPGGILGPRELRWLLVARGVTGFFGIYGMWYSAMYLPLAEATVITFLAPNIAGYLCHVFLKDPFTRTEQLASLLALGGVVLITRPASLFFDGDDPAAAAAVQGQGSAEKVLEVLANATAAARGSGPEGEGFGADVHGSTTSERLVAIGVALVGVLGGSFAFTTLRAIGQRTHPVTSVNYFSTLCVVVTFSVLSLAPLLDYQQPDLRLALPSSAAQWGLLLLITTCGLATQVLMTKGLAAERSNRATLMTYTHMLFAAGFDRFIWGTTISWMSATGSAMIITGAVWVAVGKKGVAKGKEGDGDVERAAAAAGALGAEGVPMLRDEGVDGDVEEVMLERIR
ncbi:hypothetical protein F5Y19DRAFT_239690 [Xylariaceae sp. FL1651]|nr:hypothetical protein F5Y19DRAFT_239690 [Xylariaceae sp. FL1651]